MEKKVTLLEIFNSHIDENRRISSYEHPGTGMINNQMMQDIANDVAEHLKDGTLRSDDLHMRVNYNKPESKQGNQKLKGIIYIASHPLIDCYLDGLERKKPSCTGLMGWCYVFSNFFYKSFGKQLSMLANSILYILEPDRAKQEIQQWINDNKRRFVRDSHGHIAFRTDESGDITYCLPMWLELAKANEDINFYAYTKQFAVLNTVEYCINTVFPNFRILLSDSTKDDPNPITQVREDYGSFAVLFKNVELTPDRVIAITKLATYKAHKCPGVHMGCFKCTKCSEPETENTKHIVADEH